MVMISGDYSKAALVLYPDCYETGECLIAFPECRKYEYGEFAESGIVFPDLPDYVEVTKCEGFKQADEMLQYSSTDIDHAFKLGAPMFGVSEVTIRTDLGSTNNDEINVEVIDTFGNSILLEFDRTGKESESGGEGETDYWSWTIQKATIQFEW